MDGMFLKIYQFRGTNPVAVMSVTQRRGLLNIYRSALPLCHREALVKAVQNHVKSLNWGHRVQLHDK